jgi:plasmid stabilization system protein ParE
LKPLRWLDSAVAEAYEAAAYYGERTERGATHFGEQMWAAVTLVREYPEAGAPFGLPYRRVPFRRYPYSLVYLPDDDGILIVAVRHDRMMPLSWEELM